ncbi:MAG: tetratricopeptide repeat protein [Melioribacteraceae bacterium]|nr:tetratricopeptide repeat protein [Melioribacteraceae bacterium]
MIIFSLSAICSFAQISSDPLAEIKNLISTGDVETAKVELHNYLMNNESAEANFLLGKIYLNEFDFKSAETYLINSTVLDSANINYRLTLGYNYLQQSNDPKALEQYEIVLREDSSNFSALTNAGKIYLDLGQTQKAQIIYQTLVEQKPGNSYFRKMLAICDLRLGLFDSARVNLLEAHKLNENDLSIITTLSNLLVKLKLPDSALVFLEKGIQISRGDLRINRAIADINFNQKNYVSSIKYYLNTTLAGDTSATIYQKLGLSYYFLSTSGNLKSDEVINLKLNSAIDALKASIEKDEDNALSYLYLGLSYKELDSLEKAIEFLELSQKKAIPDYISDIYTHLGISYELLVDYPNSISSYQNALKYNDEKSNLYFYLGSVYDKWYKDKSVPLMYYQIYLTKTNNQNPIMTNYAQERIEQLKEAVHFMK